MNFDYLKPPKEVYQVKHDPYYVKHGEGVKHVRKLFFLQQFDEYEEQKIQELEQLIHENQLILPNYWSRELTLKYVYSGGFNAKKCLERLKKHLEWRIDPAFQDLTPQAEQYLKDGYLYSFGRDHQFRPVVYIRLYLVSKLKVCICYDNYQFQQLDMQTLLCAATNLLQATKENMYVPGYVENWIVIIDIGGSGLFDTAFSTLSKINDILSINYTSTLHKMFILNPSFLFLVSWKIVEKIIHPETAAKIEFLKPTEYVKMQKLIDPAQIEEKYGGTHPDVTNYWPIINTITGYQPGDIQDASTQQFQQIPLQKFEVQHSLRESDFHSLHNDSFEFFTQKFIPQKGAYQEEEQEKFESLGNSQFHNNDLKSLEGSQPNNSCCTTCVIF